jgi:hypothetical protein
LTAPALPTSQEVLRQYGNTRHEISTQQPNAIKSKEEEITAHAPDGRADVVDVRAEVALLALALRHGVREAARLALGARRRAQNAVLDLQSTESTESELGQMPAARS